MSFTPLDGIPMASRCGALDPGVLLYLLREADMSLEQLDDLLHHRSGLLGVSGLSGDVRTLLASSDPHAVEALDLFAYRTSQAIASHAVALDGIDALVFTAGIGEHAAAVRAAICRHLAWLGLTLDEAANQGHGPRISHAHSRVSAWVIPTNEERAIARHAWTLTGPASL
jgi:acetate kinase